MSEEEDSDRRYWVLRGSSCSDLGTTFLLLNPTVRECKGTMESRADSMVLGVIGCGDTRLLRRLFVCEGAGMI